VDDLHRLEERVPNLTDEHVGQSDAALKGQEAEIHEV
jgi:ribosome recycling factor